MDNIWNRYQNIREQVLELDADVNMEIEARFKLIIPYLSVFVTPELSGIIPAGMGPRQSNGSPHIIMAQPLAGYTFLKWEGEGIQDPSNPTTTIDFNDDTTIKAIFEKKKIFLTITPSIGGYGIYERIKGSESSFDINATANDGYEFVRWQGSNAIKDKTSPNTSINLKNHQTITPIFRKKELTPTKIKIVI